ncbi:MAG: PqiC family protein [Gammaproteobacteria bacterium]
MRSDQKMLRRIWMGCLLVLLAACGSSPKTEFYQLNADMSSAMQAANLSEGPAIGVWQVELPDLLDRSEIVTRDNQFKIAMADFSWWAGNLSQNMSLLIVTELSQQLQSNRVVMSPWPSYRKNDYQVIVRVQRFDGVLGGEVVLRGLWSLLDGDGTEELNRQVFEFKTNTADLTYQEMVTAMSRLTVKLAEQLTEGIIDQEAM